jgi:hypothetical protein
MGTLTGSLELLRRPLLHLELSSCCSNHIRIPIQMEISILFLVIAGLRLLGKGERGREEDDGTAWRTTSIRWGFLSPLPPPLLSQLTRSSSLGSFVVCCPARRLTPKSILFRYQLTNHPT